MLARVPDSECIWPRRAGIYRANQVVIVPESQETMAVDDRRSPSSQATTCGFIGVSGRVPRTSINARHSVMPAWGHIDRALAADDDVALFGPGHLSGSSPPAGSAGRPASRLFALATASISVLGWERETRVIQLWNLRVAAIPENKT